jgi:drug/metabolite transporter superfamily protein YnfA
MKYLNWDILKQIWQRMTSSKVAWMALPGGIAIIVKAILGTDIEPMLEGIFGGLWLIISVYIAANNPTNKEGF